MGKGKRERRETANRLNARAEKEADAAARYRAQAAEVRDLDRRVMYPDPAATRAIARDLEADAWVSDANAKDLAAMAKQAAKPWWR
jgi:hypothetical protein